MHLAFFLPSLPFNHNTDYSNRNFLKVKALIVKKSDGIKTFHYFSKYTGAVSRVGGLLRLSFGREKAGLAALPGNLQQSGGLIN